MKAMLTLFVVAACSSYIGAEEAEVESGLAGNLQFGWESRYYSEGRDNLDGDSIVTSTFELGFENFSLGYWYVLSPEQNYDELQLIAVYANQLGDLDYYCSFTHLEFSIVFPTREFDNEIGFGVSYGNLPYDLSLGVDAYYSLLASGYFAELSLGHSVDLTNSLVLTTTGILGINQGYVADGHDGLNHLALSIGLEYSPRDDVILSTHLTYSNPFGRDTDAADDLSLTNFFHTGVNLQWSF